MHGSEGATALVGMSGFVVGAQLEVDGELWLNLETSADVVGCAACGTRAVGHGRRRVKVRDLPIAGRPVVLVWAKRIWRCPEADCDVKTWSERSDAIRPRAELTERARAEICRRVGEDEDSVAEVARAFGVGWHTAMAAVRDHGTPLVEEPARLDGVGALGLDETKFLSATPLHRTEYVTGFVDLDRARLLDVVAGRSGRRGLAG
jgi:transposase